MVGMTVSINRVALLSLITVAMLIGIVPYALFVGQELYFPLFALIAAPAAWTEIKKFQTSTFETPSLGEFLLGGWGSVSNGAIVSTMALISYLLVWIVGFLLDLDIQSVAFWLSLSVAIFFTLAMSLVAGEELPRKLYPDSAGSSTVFYALLVERNRLFRLIGISVLILITLMILLDPRGWVLAALLTSFLIFTSMPLNSLENDEGGSPDKAIALAAISKALESAGFSVIQSPRTGRPEIDPVVATVDLLAQNNERTLVIEVKAGAHNPKAVEWREAATLRMGARAFEHVMNKTAEAPVNVQPLMMFIDRERAEGFDRFLTDSGVRVIDVPSHLIQGVTDDPGEVALAELAGLTVPDQPHPETGAA